MTPYILRKLLKMLFSSTESGVPVQFLAAIVYQHDRIFPFDGKQNPVELSREENVLKF